MGSGSGIVSDLRNGPFFIFMNDLIDLIFHANVIILQWTK